MKLVLVYHEDSPTVVVERFSESGEGLKQSSYRNVTSRSIERMAKLAHDRARHVRPFLSGVIGYVAVFAAYCQPMSEADLKRMF